MCDFRPPPDHVINPYTSKPSGYIYRGIVDITKDLGMNEKCKDEVTEEGVYRICATGGGYDFYLNGKWWGYDYMYWENKDFSCGCNRVLGYENTKELKFSSIGFSHFDYS